MGYYMRYIMADNRPIDLTTVSDVLHGIDSAYTLQPDEVPDLADLLYDGNRFAQLEINRPDEDIFQDDIAEFKDLVGAVTDANTRKVMDVLTSASALIAVEAFWEEGRSEETLAKLDPLWDWLFANRKGILQTDGEGFYDSSGFILERNFTL